MNPTQPITDDTNASSQQGAQTSGFVPGPFGGQTPPPSIPPLADPSLNTGTMPPFQFNQSDFGFGGDSSVIQPITPPNQPTQEFDPFAGGIASLNGSPDIDSQSVPTTMEGEDMINFDLPEPVPSPIDTSSLITTNNENSDTTLDFSLPETTIPEPSPEVESTAEPITETNDIMSDNSYNTAEPETTTEPETIYTEPEIQTNDINNNNVNDVESYDENTQEAEGIQEEKEGTDDYSEEGGTDDYSTPPSPDQPDYEHQQPTSHSLETTFNNFIYSLQQLLQLKNTTSTNILGHRTDDEEVQYEFNHQNENTAIIKHHYISTNGTSTVQTLGFDNSNGLKVMFNDEIISHYGVESEDDDTTYYLNDKLNKFTTMINDEITKEEKKLKEERNKKKKNLELLRGF